MLPNGENSGQILPIFSKDEMPPTVEGTRYLNHSHGILLIRQMDPLFSPNCVKAHVGRCITGRVVSALCCVDGVRATEVVNPREGHSNLSTRPPTKNALLRWMESSSLPTCQRDMCICEQLTCKVRSLRTHWVG